MGENDAFCTSCGAKQNSLDVITYGTNKNVSEKKNKKIVMIVILAVVIVSIAIGLLIYFNTNEDENDDSDEYLNGYDAAVEQFIDFYYYYEREKADVLVVAPENFWQRWADIENDGNIESLFEDFEQIGEKRKDEAKGKNIVYQLYYVTELSSKECQSVEKALESRDRLNYSGITDAYSFKLEITDKEDGSKKDWDVVAVEMDGMWYLATYGNKVRWLVDVVI